jgi:DNA-directed RNA polymerase specialized sigma subunit
MLVSSDSCLDSNEKKLLYLKFHLEKTDKEIVQALGVTRQAVTKSKMILLDKLKAAWILGSRRLIHIRSPPLLFSKH